MIPQKTDPRWTELIFSTDVPALSALPTKMLLMRVRLLAKSRNPDKIHEAIEIAHDYFTKNEVIIKQDIEILFPKKEKA